MSQKKEPEKKAKHVSSTDPGSITVPPVEGRNDIGTDETSQEKATTNDTWNEPHLESKEPAEGRNDIAEDLAQEKQQSYSSHHSGQKDRK